MVLVQVDRTFSIAFQVSVVYVFQQFGVHLSSGRHDDEKEKLEAELTRHDDNDDDLIGYPWFCVVE